MIITLKTNAGNDLSIEKYWSTPKHITHYNYLTGIQEKLDTTCK